jgi:hypothetical protein
MELKLNINFDKDVTCPDVEAALENVFALARTASETNAAKTTVSFDDKKPCFTLQIDDDLRAVLRLDAEASLDVLSAGVDDTDEESKQRFELAKRTVLRAHAFCTTECEPFRHGTCPFVMNEKQCPKYK